MAGRSAGLALALAACVAASLLHHVHNAEYLQDYPNLPGTLTRGGVYAAWLAEAVMAFAGYVLLRLGKEKTGLALIGLYALIGFGGLAHYYAAPLAAHTPAMNATIWLEALTAALLLVTVARRIAG